MCKFASIKLGADRSVDHDLKEAFVKLALMNDNRDPMGWCIMGSEQATLKGKGNFHGEGRYQLGCAAKFWHMRTNGTLTAQSICKHHHEPKLELFTCSGPWGRALASDRDSLEVVFFDLPHSPIKQVSR